MGTSGAPTDVDVLEARPAQLQAIATIYAAEVRDSPATFDLEPPPDEHWHALLASTDRTRGHLLLAASDGDGRTLGYALSGTYMTRAAYDTTCLTSVYVARSARGRGIGRALYGGLFERLDASPLRLAVAGITEPNPASTALHRAFGFERVGTFAGVGVKFGKAWDVTWYQRRLRALRPSPGTAPSG